MKTTEQLINNLAGQLSGINRMIKEKKECLDVIAQLKAVKSGLSAVMNKYVEDNFKDCLKKGVKPREQKIIKKLFSEITKNN
ncbi:metal-sensitive transcriptional regulator [Candidatus Falkowbacteria bacterium]|nr:MAG: metal-sensitive transcriptional regulator [Candidatus Falkowbacteria bacterium]